MIIILLLETYVQSRVGQELSDGPDKCFHYNPTLEMRGSIKSAFLKGDFFGQQVFFKKAGFRKEALLLSCLQSLIR